MQCGKVNFEIGHRLIELINREKTGNEPDFLFFIVIFAPSLTIYKNGTRNDYSAQAPSTGSCIRQYCHFHGVVPVFQRCLFCGGLPHSGHARSAG